MPNWSDPLEISKDKVIFTDLCLALLGLYTWEIIVQFPFDWSVISRKRVVHWPAFFYFYCKYSVWIMLVGIAVVLNTTTRVNCQAVYTFNQLTGFTALGAASTLLMLRTIAVWRRDPLVTASLVVASLGQWVILLHGVVTVRGSWDDVFKTCSVDYASPAFMKSIYLYTMSFDFIVMVLTAIGLLRSPGRSSLWHLLFRQGIIYFLIAFLANMVPTVFILLDLNPVMNIMFAPPAGITSTIVACRSFVSLTSFVDKDVYVHSPTPRAPSHPPPSGGFGSHHNARTDGPCTTPQKSGMGDTIAVIALRTMGMGIDTMAPAFSTDELDASRTINSPATLDSKPRYSFGGASESGEAVVVHAGAKV